MEYPLPETELLEETTMLRVKNTDNARRVTWIQIAACALILLAALALRFSGAEWYQAVRTWYLETLNQSLVAGDEWQEAAEHTGAQLLSLLQQE